MKETAKFCPTCGKHKDAPKMKPDTPDVRVNAWPVLSTGAIIIEIGGLWFEVPQEIVMESKRATNRNGKNNIIRVGFLIDDVTT